MQLDSPGAAILRPTLNDASRLSIDEVSDQAALAALTGEWNDLMGRAREGSFFASWEWMAAWLESFQGDRPLAALLARRGSTLVGILPLLVGYRRWAWGRRGLETAMNEQSPSEIFLCEGDPAPALEAFLEHVSRTRGRVALSLPLFPAGSPAVAALREIAARSRFRVFEKPSRCSTRIRIQTSWEGYLATRSKHTQKEWRRKRKRLDEAGRVDTRTVTAREDLPNALADVLEIESHSWKHETGTSFQKEAGVEHFYSRLAELCADRGWLRLSLLYLDGRPAAHCFGVVHGNELLALKTSFSRELASLSPGLALMLCVSEQAFREGLAAVDLLGHPDRWKTEMANEERAHVDLCIFPRGLVEYEAHAFLEGRVEPFLRERLPPRVTRAGQRVLARLRHHH